jgi:hypothetical protein
LTPVVDYVILVGVKENVIKRKDNYDSTKNKNQAARTYRWVGAVYEGRRNDRQSLSGRLYGVGEPQWSYVSFFTSTFSVVDQV